MKKIYLSALLVSFLAACSTPTPETKAQVESRTETKPATVTTPPVDTQALNNDGVAGKLLPHQDPNNKLSERSVYFDYDKYEVKSEYRPLVEAHAKYLSENRKLAVKVGGNTDERGSREYNLALGQKRADAVKKMLNTLGVSDSQIEAISYGEEKPKAQGQDEEAYAANRRADIIYGDDK